MRNFRLNYLFCLILVVGVSLMWWTWSCSTDYTANRLLRLRQRLDQIDYPELLTEVPPFVVDGVTMVPEQELTALLAEMSGARAILDPTPPNWHRDISLWMKCKVDALVDANDHIVEATWVADWPAIVARARKENWTFYRQVFVTVLAVLTIGWTVWTRATTAS